MDPAFFALWLISLVVVVALGLRLALRTTLTLWILAGEGLEAAAMRARRLRRAPFRPSQSAPVRITAPRRRTAWARRSDADSRRAA